MMNEKIFPYLNLLPEIAPNVFLASGVKIIGNIKLELVNWKSEGWQPPKYKYK